MHCPYCDQEHPEGIRFCPTTGHELAIATFCTNCGTEIDMSWKVCPNCGGPVNAANSLNSARSKPVLQLKRFPSQILILSVLFLSIIVLGIVIYSRSNHETVTQPEATLIAVPSAVTEGSTTEEYRDAWLTPLPSLKLVELGTSNASALNSIGRLGRGIPQAISASPKGNQIAVGTTTGISIIDVQSYKEIVYIEENAKVTSVAYSPDGSRLTAGLSDGRIVIYDAGNSVLMMEIPYLASFPYYDPNNADYDVIAAFTLDGQYVIGSLESPYYAASVDAFDPASGEKRFSFSAVNPIFGIDCSLDGQYIAVGSAPVSILNAATGEVVQTVSGVNGQIGQVKFDADAKSLAVGTQDNGIFVWDLGSQSIIEHISNQQLQIGTLYHMDFAPDGRGIIFHDDENDIGLYNLETDQLVWSRKTSDLPIYALELDKNSNLVISGGMDGQIRFLSLSNGQEIKQLRSGHRNTGDLDFSPDGSLLAAGHERRIEVWRMPDGLLITELPGASSGLLAFNPNGRSIAVDRGDGVVNLLQLRDGSLIGRFKGGKGIARAIDFLQGGQILASAFDDPIVALESAVDGKIIKDFPGASEPIAASPDGSILAFSSSKDGAPAVALFDTQSGQIVEEIVGDGSFSFRDISFNAEGKLLAAGGGYPGTIVVWDLSTKTEIFRVDDMPANSLAFSPSDPWLLASSSGDGLLRFWDIKNNQMIKEIAAGSNCYETCLAFSPDGKLLVTGSEDGSIRLWGVAE